VSGAEPSNGERPGERPSLKIGPDNWPSFVADKIVEIVGTVRSNTTDRVVVAVRAIVFALVAIVAVIGILVALTVAAVRIADAYLPIGSGVGSATWAAHGYVGLFFVTLGFGAWRARSGSTRGIYLALIFNALLIIGIVFYGVIDAIR